MTETKARWSEGNQIFMCDSFAYGVAPDLQNVCIGTEEEILKALNGNKKTDNRMINNILTMEINNRGKEMPSRKHRHNPTRTHRMTKGGH